MPRDYPNDDREYRQANLVAVLLQLLLRLVIHAGGPLCLGKVLLHRLLTLVVRSAFDLPPLLEPRSN